jgi:hypothetical protein
LFLFEAGKPARNITKVPHLQGDVIWALVDGDVDGGQPHPHLIDWPSIRIVMASSPRTPESRKWLKQKVAADALLFMKTWSVKELSFVGCVLLFFLLKGQLGS